MDAAHFIAVDLGATSGRVMHARLDGERIELTEIHRFANEPVMLPGALHWDILGIWAEMLRGLRRYARGGGAPLAGIGVATWGVDYALLGADGRLLANPHHYRDGRTAGRLPALHARIGEGELYAATGIPSLELNTSTQLFSAVEQGESALAAAKTPLTTPDLLHYWLCGRVRGELTMASTTQLLDAHRDAWSPEMCERLGIDAALLPPLISPGTVLGPIRAEVAAATGLSPDTPVIASASHDTASAVAAVPELSRGDAFLSSGSWSLLGVERDGPVTTPGALAQGLSNERGAGGKTLLLRNIPGLWLLEECRRAWRAAGRDYDWPELLAGAEAAEPFAYLVDPAAASLTAPGDALVKLADYCAGTGQALPSEPAGIVRGYLESLALAYSEALAGLEGVLGESIRTVRVVGGGSRNALLNQLTADACGRAVVAGPVEATALGNVVAQAAATGRLGDVGVGRRVVGGSVERSRFVPGGGVFWGEARRRYAGLVSA